MTEMNAILVVFSFMLAYKNREKIIERVVNAEFL